jgi:16S rRNA (guanine1207-N2)-methyltransferase/23S rRNA (guanine1835-N2)-methyltransferase
MHDDMPQLCYVTGLIFVNTTQLKVTMNNTNQLHIQAQQLCLKRFPANHFDKSLRAWDAADEYMIDHLAELASLDEIKHIVIVNDSFGALTCAMAKLAPQAMISVFTDSYMAKRGILQNLMASNLDKNKVSVHSFLDLADILHIPNSISVDVVLLKIPRTLAYLDYMLLMLNDVFTSLGAQQDKQIEAEAGVQEKHPLFISGAMVKLVTSSVMSIFDNRMSETSSSLARKKARLVFAHFKKQSSIETAATPESAIYKVQDKEIPFVLHNFPNVFCREQVDIGARFMLKALPKMTMPNQVVIDLGCGNGILGISLLTEYKHNPPKVIFVDESYMAIASARSTLENSDANEQSKLDASFIVGHCLDEIIQQHKDEDKSWGVDYVICNPPFHQQSTIIDDIAWQMFVDAKKVLKVGGELRIVGNRHLDHRAKLSKLFGGCKVVASDKKFAVLSAIKQ